MSHFQKYASVVLDVALDKPLDYGIPSTLVGEAKRGMRVEVPVRGHARAGFIYEIKDAPGFAKVLPITKFLSEKALLTDDLFELAVWMSKYYCAPLSQVLKAMLPSSIRKNVKPKEQLFVMRAKTKEQLKQACLDMRQKWPAQSGVLDVMLQVRKGILLSELLEKTNGSRSPVDSLVNKGLLSIDIVRLDRSPLTNEEYFQSSPKKLNEDQQRALDSIHTSLASEQFRTHLIHGITGSGKTEIYLQAISRALAMGRSTIVLVPEISLTTQTIERFRSRFKEKIAVLHHRLSHGERHDEWSAIRSGEASIVIGARSAIFCPAQRLGLIIVDEEHEYSYKQSDEAPCYNARDVAVVRGKIAKATVLLGSATPSLESYHNAKTDKYLLNTLQSRAEASSTPHVTIVDMKKEFQKSKGYTNFSDTLLEGIERRRTRGEQTILFLNRRGYHTTFFCQECREALKCNHCDVALTFHLNANALKCHMCGFFLSPPPKACPKCKNPEPMKNRGVGTELLEKSLHAVFPDIRSIRIDADTTRHKGSHQKLLRDFGTGKADVLIGTQMIAKGLHFPEVTLVGIINCDANLHIPDFRASEITFQLLTQVSGRAGRGHILGEVILQTCMPDNNIIKHASNQDYATYYEEEISSRETFEFPPFTRLVKAVFSGKDEKKTYDCGEKLRAQVLRHLPEKYEVYPVIPSGHAKIKDRYRFQLIIKGQSIYKINSAIKAAQGSLSLPSSIKVLIDIDPASTFF